MGDSTSTARVHYWLICVILVSGLLLRSDSRHDLSAATNSVVAFFTNAPAFRPGFYSLERPWVGEAKTTFTTRPIFLFSPVYPVLTALEKEWEEHERARKQSRSNDREKEWEAVERAEKELRFEAVIITDLDDGVPLPWNEPRPRSATKHLVREACLFQTVGENSGGWCVIHRPNLPNDSMITNSADINALIRILGSPENRVDPMDQFVWRLFTFRGTNRIETLTVFHRSLDQKDFKIDRGTVKEQTAQKRAFDPEASTSPKKSEKTKPFGAR